MAKKPRNQQGPSSDHMTLNIGAYETVEEIGRGAMGVVYAARHIIDGSQVALKTLFLSQLADDLDNAAERFTREIMAARSLHHPGIVRLIDSGRDSIPPGEDVLYYAMELLPGETLHESLRHGPFFPEEAAAIIAGLCDALAAAHAAGIVHRDIKPANVFLTPARRVVLTDFGICKITNLKTLTTAGVLVGTVPFLAPEQFLEGPVDGRTDVFALGALLYTLVTRQYLRPVNAVASMIQAVKDGTDVAKAQALQGYPPQLIQVMTRALQSDPGQRFQSMPEMQDALRPLVGSIPIPGTNRIIPSTRRQRVEPVAPAAPPPPAPAAPAAAAAPGRPLGEDELFDAAMWSFQTGAEPIGTGKLEVLEEQAQRRQKQQLKAPAAPDGTAAAQDLAAGGAEPFDVSGTARTPSTRGWLVALALVTLLAAVALSGHRTWMLSEVTVQIESLPAGATVRVNGEEVGQAPLTLRIPRGKREARIELRAEARQPYRIVVGLPLWGGVQPIVAAMPFQWARLAVETRPPGASVSLDGQKACASPCQLESLEPGQLHLVEVLGDGCEPELFAIKPEPGQVLQRSLALKPMTPRSLGLLKVLFEEGPVLLDGEDVTEELEAGELLVSAGFHRLQHGISPRQHALALSVPPGGARRVDLRRPARTPRPPKRIFPRGQPPRDDPRAIEVYMDYATYLLARGKERQAKAAFFTALTYFPQSIRVHRGLAMASVATGQISLALGHLHAVLNQANVTRDSALIRRLLESLAQPDRCTTASR